MMTARGAAFRGIVKVLSSPSLVGILWILNVLVSLPAVIVISDSLETSLGGSLVADNMRASFDMGWYGEYRASAKGLEETVVPSITGAGGVFDNLEAWWRGDLFTSHPSLVALGLFYAMTWSFFSGGILTRYGEGGGLFRLSDFLAASASFWLRFTRLALLTGFLYYLIYRLSGVVFRSVEARTKDMTAEDSVLAYVLAASVLIVFLMTFVNMVADYARIATYRENRRSMVFAMIKGVGFVLGHLGRTTTLYYGLGALGLFALCVYHWLAPGASQSTASGIVLAFVFGQLFLIFKLVLRLSFYASQLALYDADTW